MHQQHTQQQQNLHPSTPDLIRLVLRHLMLDYYRGRRNAKLFCKLCAG